MSAYNMAQIRKAMRELNLATGYVVRFVDSDDIEQTDAQLTLHDAGVLLPVHIQLPLFENGMWAANALYDGPGDLCMYGMPSRDMNATDGQIVLDILAALDWHRRYSEKQAARAKPARKSPARRAA